jgi:undecaprenyl-diphosphatase
MNHWMFEQVNHFAAATPWLHGIAQAYADDGVFLFAALLVAGNSYARIEHTFGRRRPSSPS